MKAYKHTVQYYETDQMGIAHHSNYVRWMEEARVDYLAQLGWSLKTLEAMGAVSPVTSLDAKYKRNTAFQDVVSIWVTLTEFSGVRIKLRYVMKNEAGEDVFVGHSEHCFFGPAGAYPAAEKGFPRLCPNPGRAGGKG